MTVGLNLRVLHNLCYNVCMMPQEQNPKDPAPTRRLNKSKRLTPRQLRFVNNIPTAKTGTQAAIDAGYSPKCAAEVASQLLDDPTVQGAVAAAMKRKGLSIDDMIEPIKDSLKAMKDDDRHPDHAIRLKGAETGLRLAGHLSQKVEVNTQSMSISQIVATIREESRKRGLPE